MTEDCDGDIVGSMGDDILNTIDVLSARVTVKEDEANKLKKLVNELCGEAGISIRYPAILESGGIGSIRADQFYGLPLTAAIRNYLELRKSGGLGAASPSDIFRAIKDGGYKFDTKNDEIARISVGNALRKTSSIFHRLPNGQYGLLSWYPSARMNPEHAEPKSNGRKAGKPSSKRRAVARDGERMVTSKDIREVVLKQTGDFLGADIEKAVRAAHPGKQMPPNKVANVLFLLKKNGILKIVKERSGKTGATFGRA